MNNCENIANQIASRLGTNIKAKAADSNKSAAWCNGTYANNLTYRILENDAGTVNGIKITAAYNVTISNESKDSPVSVTLSAPSNWSNDNVAGRAANAWNGAGSAS